MGRKYLVFKKNRRYYAYNSFEEMIKSRMQELYAKCVEENQAFMDELAATRQAKHDYLMRKTTAMIGPIWYQVLSPGQRQALDNLQIAIKQDVLEDKASRTRTVIMELGIFPIPTMGDLMECIFFGRKKAIEFIAEVFKMLFNHSVHIKRESYPINARLLMSAICYLGMEDLIKLLIERFHTEPEIEAPPVKPKRKKKLAPLSPYLVPIIAVPPAAKPLRKKPVIPPLPSLSDDILNLTYDDEPILSTRPPPPLPPRPAPKARLSLKLCDEIAGISLNPGGALTTYTMKVQRTSETQVTVTKVKAVRLKDSKQAYGISVGRAKKKRRYKKVDLHPTPFPNLRYIIVGVAIVNGKAIYILNGVSIAKSNCNMINNGVFMVDGYPVTVIGGFFNSDPPPFPLSCDCMKWETQVMTYYEKSKCRCGHHYDFYNEGSLKPHECIYFTPPTRTQPYFMDDDRIFELDQKRIYADSVIREVIYNDSVVGLGQKHSRSDNGERGIVRVKTKCPGPGFTSADLKLCTTKCPSTLRLSGGGSQKNIRTVARKTKRKSQSHTSIDSKPEQKPQEYLKYALQTMRRLNVLASLPDAHLVPELLEWMRYRLHGPITKKQRARYLDRSKIYWQFYQSLGLIHWGHVSVPKLGLAAGLTHITWLQKKMLMNKFSILKNKYRRKFFKSAAKQYNLLWPTMFQDVMPDVSFRRVFFAYIGSRQEHYHMLRPYNSREAMERKLRIDNKRVSCIEKFVSQKLE